MTTRRTADHVAIWHNVQGTTTRLLSDLGPIDGTANLTVTPRHCPGRGQCTRIGAPLGRQLLLSRALIADLLKRGASQKTIQDTDYLTIHVDHVAGSGKPATATYQLIAARWKNCDSDSDNDSGLMIGIWPD